MKKRAFTLIELLVVIAIIAILAAILFPVFAQAKVAAKRAASLSNIKQITLAEIMYENDYDDDFVISENDVCDNACPSSPGTSVCIDNLTAPAQSWSLALEPYIKTLGLYIDPGTGDPNGFFSLSGPNSVPQNWNNFAEYGYNYEFLSPLRFTSTTVLGNGTLCCKTATNTGAGRSSTLGIHPANTIMFTTAQWFAEGGLFDGKTPNAAYAWTAGVDDNMANAPGTDFSLLPSQDRVFIIGFTCFSAGPSLGYCGWVRSAPTGQVTADVRTQYPYAGGNFGWCDGHAKYVTGDALAAGTDYATAGVNSHPDPIYSYGTGCIVNGLASSGNNQFVGATNALALAAPNNYLWDLDGTLSDIN